MAIVKLAIKSHLHCKWNQQWIESTKGSITKHFFPTVLSVAILLRHHPSYLIILKSKEPLSKITASEF